MPQLSAAVSESARKCERVILQTLAKVSQVRVAERMASALRVIHTWATVDGALVPEQVRKLTSRTLKKESV